MTVSSVPGRFFYLAPDVEDLERASRRRADPQSKELGIHVSTRINHDDAFGGRVVCRVPDKDAEHVGRLG